MPEPANVNSTVSVDGVLQPAIDNIEQLSNKRLLNMEAFTSNPAEQSDAPIFGGGEFYAPVMRTTSFLSKLYGILQVLPINKETTFDELAQDAIDSCRLSVHHAVYILIREHVILTKIVGNGRSVICN